MHQVYKPNQKRSRNKAKKAKNYNC